MTLTGKHKALIAGSLAIAGIAGFVSCCGVTTADRTDTGVATETAGERVRAVPTCVVCFLKCAPPEVHWTCFGRLSVLPC